MHHSSCPGYFPLSHAYKSQKTGAATATGIGFGGDARRDEKQRKEGKNQAMLRGANEAQEWKKQLASFAKENHTLRMKKGQDASTILNTLKQVLRCQAPDWWWKQPQRSLYLTAMQVCDVLTRHYPKAWGDPADYESAMAALEELSQTARLLVKQLEKEDSSPSIRTNAAKVPKVAPLVASTSWFSNQFSSSKDTHDKDSSVPLGVVEIHKQAAAAVRAVLETPELSMLGSHDYYRQRLRPLAFDTVEAFESPSHSFGSSGGHAKIPDFLSSFNGSKFGVKAASKSTPSSKKPSIKNDATNGVKTPATVLWKELSSYPTSLPIEFGSSIFVRCLENQMDMLRVLIIGPEGTPYENGCFIFDVHMGHDYPKAPPKVQFMTTCNFLSAGAHKYRFNPNLYECGKVCLSLLGTWSGPGWQPGESTLLQVLVSVQSLILGTSDPYFNEPGYESSAGTPQGKAASEKYNKNIRKYTMEAAILPFLKNQLSDHTVIAMTANGKRKDPKGADATSRKYYAEFADVVKEHFRLKHKVIQKQLYNWLQDDSSLQMMYNDYWNIWEQLEQESKTESAAAAVTRVARRAKRAKVDAPALKVRDGVILLDDDDDDPAFEAATATAIQASRKTSASRRKTNEVVFLDDSDNEDERKPAAVAPSSKPAAKGKSRDHERGENKRVASDDFVDLSL
jgi:ubiquitin-protein ligase